MARDLGIHAKTLRVWVRQDEADAGARAERLASAQSEQILTLRCEARDLRRADEIPRAASVLFARELDQFPPS